MTIDEVVQIFNASQSKPLTKLQEWLLRQAWEGKTYAIMAGEANYTEEYLRRTAAELWSYLSSIWGEPITKPNFRSILEPRRLSQAQKQLIEDAQQSSAIAIPEFPSGPIALDSPFYIPRPPLEELAYEEIAKPGNVIRIKAPRKMGKSSLLLRIGAYANSLNYRTVTIDLQQADNQAFSSLDRFLRWFSANVSLELGLEPQLDRYWKTEIGSKVSCTIYFQSYILTHLNAPLVLLLNEVNRIFEYPEIARDFLPMLRVWYEQGKTLEIWQKLRLVVAYSTEVYIPLRLNQSPFNIGFPLKLPPFTPEQTDELARRYQIEWTDSGKTKRLMALLGGHPYLIQLAFFHLHRQEISLKQLLEQAPTASGIYRDHLLHLRLILQAEPPLENALKQTISADRPVELEPVLAYKLDSLGLISLEGDLATPSCELYRLYFRNLQGAREPAPSENRFLGVSEPWLGDGSPEPQPGNQDELTQLANRRYFHHYLKQAWQQAEQRSQPLSLILADIDCFRAYNDTYGFSAGDTCLQRVAVAIDHCIHLAESLVARYGGEEFAIALPNLDEPQAIQLAEALRAQIQQLGIAHSSSLVRSPLLTLSFGVASIFPDRSTDINVLIDTAARALYLSKMHGRDRVTFLNYT